MTDKELNSHDLAREIEISKLQEENEELKSLLRGTTHCFDEEEHNKLKEEITNLSKDVDMWNAKYNDMFDENRELEKQLHEASLQIQELIEQDIECPSNCSKLKDLLKQQQEFIKYLENCIKELEKESPNKLQNVLNLGIRDITEEILRKYKEIIGVDKDGQ